MNLSLDEISFWPENNRTIFTFERLVRLEGELLENLSIDKITTFVAEQDTHKLEVLAESIRRNGVQVPLIIRDDGKLLDGNRRYFACRWIRMNPRPTDRPEVLAQIPVLVIREKDLTKELELKILAEANFIPSLKVPWPLDAQARAVDEYYREVKRNLNLDDDGALVQVVGVFGIARQRAVDLMEALRLTKEFIKEGDDKDDRIRRRGIVEDKFVYFWEFLNKAMKGRGAYTEADQLKEVKTTFFMLMAKGPDNPITNVKQIEPLAQARRDATAWSILTESKGEKLTTVVSIMNEKKEVRKAEDKIRVFLAWLKEARDLTPKAKELLAELAEIAKKKSRV